MNYEDWINQRNQWFAQYPINENHFRLDIELKYPCNKLSQVPVKFNPHGGYDEIASLLFPHMPPKPKYDEYECFYVCDDWSIIFEPKIIGNGIKMLVESEHKNPWGERIRLMSTASSIIHESWARYKNWNDFAFWRGKYWAITWNEYFADFPFGKGYLPYADRRHYGYNAIHGEFIELE